MTKTLYCIPFKFSTKTIAVCACVCVCVCTVFLSHKGSVTSCVAIYLFLWLMLDGNVKMRIKSKNVHKKLICSFEADSVFVQYKVMRINYDGNTFYINPLMCNKNLSWLCDWRMWLNNWTHCESRETATLGYVSQKIVFTTQWLLCKKILVSFLKISFWVIKSTMLPTFTCHFYNIKNVNGVYDIDNMTTALFWLVNLSVLQLTPCYSTPRSPLYIFIFMWWQKKN